MSLYTLIISYFNFIKNYILSNYFIKITVIIFCFIILIIFLINAIYKLSKFIIFLINVYLTYKDNSKASVLLNGKYSGKYLLKRSFLIENILCKNNPSISMIIGIDELWIERLIKKKRKKDFQRVLSFASDKGLFECLKVSLKKKRYGNNFISWINKNGDIINIQKLAMLSNGNDFNRIAALSVLKSKLSRIRELLGSFEWIQRYFAVKIILLDSDENSIRLIWEALRDPHYLIRKIIVEEFKPKNNEEFYNELYKLMIEDPMFDVRKTCWDRIHKDYSEFFEINQKKLMEKEALYLLQLLDINSKSDENFALHYLENNNLELRFTAATYLDNCGCLYRLVHEVDLGDKNTLNRNFELLKKAAEVNVASYLKCVEETNNPASLLIAAKILVDKGDIFHITVLAKKVFYLYRGEKDYLELYEKTIECVSERGNERALRLLNYEINKRRDDEIVKLVISYIPERYENIFIDTLFDLLTDKYFQFEENLYLTFLKIPVYAVLPITFGIINDNTERYTREIKIRAVKLLGRIKMHYCLQVVLENLNLMSINEAFEFTKVLSEYPSGLFNKKVDDLVNSIDSKIRASVISVLPATKNRDFIKTVLNGLKDADPDVRIASISALTGFEDYKSLNEITDMLFDPVERVRTEASIALSKNGSRNTLKMLEKILNDPDEVLPVKKAIVTGLGHSKLVDSIEIIMQALELYDELYETAVISLSQHTEKNEIKQIIEYFKDGSPKLKDRIVKSFIMMREKGEEIILDLLKDENQSLNNYIADILENTGYVDQMIKTINNKDLEIRKNAVNVLTLIGTKKCYRGVIAAIFDPDNEIRVKVIKAIEKLEHNDNKKILKELENDPDKKVRKYILWAMEKLKAKEI